MTWRAAIGLEIHAQLSTATKLFCGCPTAFDERPNVHVCPVCLGHPGTLPRLNAKTIDRALRVVLALGMTAAPEVRFDRKHYIYPDLSKNFQTSQFHRTIGRDGRHAVEVRGKRVEVRIRECHLEEDAARLVHVADESMVDYNRCGVPLLEIVTEPDFEIGEEAEAFFRDLALLLRALGVSDANMELGQLRCDANVSVSDDPARLGERTELKNLNSARFVRLAIDFEISRQIALREAGGAVRRETRSWNENRGITESMRSKEEAHDYRYMPEPDLAVVAVTEADLAAVRAALPELPAARIARLARERRLDRAVARDLVAEPGCADFFERAVAAGAEPELAANWLLNQVRALHNERKLGFVTTPLAADAFAALLVGIAAETVSTTNARKALALAFETGRPVDRIVAEENLGQISDEAAIDGWVAGAIGANPRQVEKFRGGDRKVFEFLVGQVQKTSRGRANPRKVRHALRRALGDDRVLALRMGGAVCARRGADGLLHPADEATFRAAVAAAAAGGPETRVEAVTVSEEFSENLTPHDWFDLYARLAALASEEEFRGVVVLHGLDTLAYTATLIRWLLPALPFPVVFTGAVHGLDDPDGDADANLRDSLRLAGGSLAPGVWVRLGGETLPAYNLQPTGTGTRPLALRNAPEDPLQLERLASGRWKVGEVTREGLEAAVARILVARVYPGFDPKWLELAAGNGVTHFLLELYDTGTATVRPDAARSLLPAVRRIIAAGGTVFCTSQRGVPITMADYPSSRELWRAGVVPLGGLVTECATTKLIAATLAAGDRGGPPDPTALIERMAGEEARL